MFLLHPCVQAQQPVMATPMAALTTAKPALSAEQIDAITKQYQPIIDKAAAMDTNGYLQKADELSARYTRREFLDPILDPEGTRITRQTAFNNTLQWSLELPIGQVPFGIGIYNGDLLQLGAMGCAWTLEWWFYYAMEHALAEGYTDFLIAHATEVCAALQAEATAAHGSIHPTSQDSVGHSPRAEGEPAVCVNPAHPECIAPRCVSKGHPERPVQVPLAARPVCAQSAPIEGPANISPSLQTVLAWPRVGFVIPRPTKKMLALMVGYAAGSLAMRWTRSHYLLDSTPTAGQQPIAISTIIPAPITEILTSCCYPQSWTDSINNVFKRFHLLPEWIDRSELVMTQALVVMLFWLRWYLKNIALPLLEQQLIANTATLTPLLTTLATLTEKGRTQQLTLDEHKQFDAAQAALKTLVQPGIDISFGTWIYCKTLQISLWHSITNILLATPAWYKVGSWAYNLYTVRN
jgi:hypothetical protein